MLGRVLLPRVLVLIVLVSVTALTAARDLLHNHDGLGQRSDCPACRVDRATGEATTYSAATVAVPLLVSLGVLQDGCLVGYAAGFSGLEPPPRSPPSSL
ncbi:MAG: hypothetical protein Q7V01_05535 [Vicinamibacterales bacterium]|nr:hypothetical protein [Vicinamibacterales bacterium]